MTTVSSYPLSPRQTQQAHSGGAYSARSLAHDRATAQRQLSGHKVPLPIVLLVASFCLPTEVSVMAGPLRLSPFRVILLINFLPSLLYLMRSRRPLDGIDLAMLLHGAWVVVALMATMGPAQAIETGGIYVVETVGAYLMARRYLDSLEAVEALARLLVSIITILFFAAFIESVSGVHFLRDLFKAFLGGPGAHAMDQRMGLTRAFTSFEHPILFGVFAASGFAMAHYILGQARIAFDTVMRLGFIALATFFSLSGGPFVALGFQGLLIGWDRITRGFQNRWAMLAGIFLGIWVMLSLASNRSPVLIFVSYLTFSTQSAYNRVHIWTYGTAEVGRHPLFGIGLHDWIRAPWMSDSMDTFWLLTTVRYGLPSLIFLLATLWLIGRRLNARREQSARFKNATKAWMVTMAGFSLAALTVHFWNALMVQFFFFIGLGAALARAPKAADAPTAPSAQMPLPPVSSQQRIDPWI